MADDERSGWPDAPGYAIHEVLGRSASATVYRATQTSVDRQVALKVASGSLDDDAATRFRTEVRRLGTLADHPHVVGVVDAGTTTSGAPFVAMELVTAGSLGDRIRAFGPLTPTEVARVGAEVADALEAAHAAGIVHGRVTPDNVLVGRRGQALLADFGIAALGSSARTEADDVFALGVTLHTLVAGEPPFRFGEEEARPLPPQVPYALVEAIGACLAPEADRPSLPQVATTLEAIAADRASAPVSEVVADQLDPPTGAVDPAPADPVPAPVPRVRTAPHPDDPTRKMIVVAVLIAVSILAAFVLAIVRG